MKTAIGIGMAGNDDWNELSEFVTEAEKLGVDYVWSAEAWGHDAVTPLAYLAAKTTRIKLGTGIMQAVARTPANTAMTAMTLSSMSHGRFILGLGASGPQVVEGWHGVPFRKPIQRIREVVEIVRIVSRGERLQYHGEVYELPLPGGEGKALKSAARPEPNIPVYLATLSPKSLELTGEIADGWIGTSFMPEHADVFFDHIARGAERAGRTLADIDLQAGGTVAFSDDVRRPDRAPPPGHRLHARRDGLAPAQLLQRRLPPRRLRGGGARRAAPLARRQAQGSGRTSCPTRWSPASISSARNRWSATASAPTATPASRRCASRPRVPRCAIASTPSAAPSTS